MLPLIALVGRPNVGKSTLFNCLTRSRDALVADQPGVTRDRHYGICRLGDRPFALVDTGGLADDDTEMNALTARQVDAAIEEADAVVAIVDARDGLMPRDEEIIRNLRRAGKPAILALNKTDGIDETMVLAEFAGLGFADMLPMAAAHRRGIDDLLQRIDANLPEASDDADEDADDGSIRVAVVGRPNAGKSTLINRLLGDDRLVVSDIAGTTRDAIRVKLERDGVNYTLIDTAGVRRRARVQEVVEKVSVIKTMRAIAAAQVVVLMVNARENLADQDLSIIGQVLDEGRALVIACNKWDGMDAYQREQCRQALDRRLRFVDWARIVFISALHGSGLRELMQAVGQAHRAATCALSSSQLTRTLEDAYSHYQPPMVRGHTPKLRYAHPGGQNPPTIVIHGTRTKHVSDAYRRYLEKVFRKRFSLQGTPVRIELRDSSNPYAGKRNTLTESQRRKRQRMIRHAKRSGRK